MKLNSSLNENITSQPIKVERHSNFELLRIIAMIMIIGHHLVVHGIQKFSGEAISYGNIINKIFINILNCGGEVGVALFFMITGFFLCKKEKTSIKKVACETAFYSVVIGIIFLITLIVEKSQSYGGGVFSDWNLRSKLTFLITSFVRPVSFGWWFVTAYILIVLFAPFINQFILKLSKRKFVYFLFFVWAFYYSIDYMFGSTYLPIIRAFLFYSAGAFVNIYFYKKISTKQLFGFIFICLIALFIMTCSSYLKSSFTSRANLTGIEKNIEILKNEFLSTVYHCIGVPLLSFCIFMIFASLRIGSRPFINKIASATFGVYLIHDSDAGRYILWNCIFNIKTQISSNYFPLLAVFDILSIFCVCVLMDFLRQKFVEKYYLSLADKIAQLLN